MKLIWPLTKWTPVWCIARVIDNWTRFLWTVSVVVVVHNVMLSAYEKEECFVFFGKEKSRSRLQSGKLKNVSCTFFFTSSINAKNCHGLSSSPFKVTYVISLWWPWFFLCSGLKTHISHMWGFFFTDTLGQFFPPLPFYYFCALTWFYDSCDLL